MESEEPGGSLHPDAGEAVSAGCGSEGILTSGASKRYKNHTEPLPVLGCVPEPLTRSSWVKR